MNRNLIRKVAFVRVRQIICLVGAVCAISMRVAATEATDYVIQRLRAVMFGEADFLAAGECLAMWAAGESTGMSAIQDTLYLVLGADGLKTSGVRIE